MSISSAIGNLVISAGVSTVSDELAEQLVKKVFSKEVGKTLVKFGTIGLVSGVSGIIGVGITEVGSKVGKAALTAFKAKKKK